MWKISPRVTIRVFGLRAGLCLRHERVPLSLWDQHSAAPEPPLTHLPSRAGHGDPLNPPLSPPRPSRPSPAAPPEPRLPGRPPGGSTAPPGPAPPAAEGAVAAAGPC